MPQGRGHGSKTTESRGNSEQSDVSRVIAIFPTWKREDVIQVLADNGNDVEAAIEAIASGLAEPFQQVGPRRTKDKPATASNTTPSSTEAQSSPRGTASSRGGRSGGQTRGPRAPRGDSRGPRSSTTDAASPSSEASVASPATTADEVSPAAATPAAESSPAAVVAPTTGHIAPSVAAAGKAVRPKLPQTSSAPAAAAASRAPPTAMGTQSWSAIVNKNAQEKKAAAAAAAAAAPSSAPSTTPTATPAETPATVAPVETATAAAPVETVAVAAAPMPVAAAPTPVAAAPAASVIAAPASFEPVQPASLPVGTRPRPPLNAAAAAAATAAAVAAVQAATISSPAVPVAAAATSASRTPGRRPPPQTGVQIPELRGHTTTGSVPIARFGTLDAEEESTAVAPPSIPTSSLPSLAPPAVQTTVPTHIPPTHQTPPVLPMPSVTQQYNAPMYGMRSQLPVGAAGAVPPNVGAPLQIGRAPQRSDPQQQQQQQQQQAGHEMFYYSQPHQPYYQNDRDFTKGSEIDQQQPYFYSQPYIGHGHYMPTYGGNNFYSYNNAGPGGLGKGGNQGGYPYGNQGGYKMGNSSGSYDQMSAGGGAPPKQQRYQQHYPSYPQQQRWHPQGANMQPQPQPQPQLQPPSQQSTGLQQSNPGWNTGAM